VFLYLRRIKGRAGYEYVIRESCKAENGWTHRDLVNLGEDPGLHIKYPGGNGFYFDPEIEDALHKKGVDYSSRDLDEVFLPFLDPHIRRVMETFRSEARPNGRWRGCSNEELSAYQAGLHSFDKRRLHFLRCGRVDIGELEGRPWKFLNILLEKSRDEIEHIIEGMERQLRPHEVRSYLYTAFHIQAYFPGHLLRNHPVGLDPEKVDDYFLEELCYLNEDDRFFKGVHGERGGGLHPYLEKYVIMYFDSVFETGDPWQAYMREFMWRRQFQPAPPSRPSMAVGDALAILGIDSAEFEKMSRADVIRRYRRRAKAMHPDQGGDHEGFVRLAVAYECLLVRK
jgi:hypothetical protein